MGSKTFDGVWFICYVHDHEPPHVHGNYGETIVIVDLLQDGTIRQASRKDAVTPRSAKRSDVKHILNVAAANAAELIKLWEKIHGSSSKQSDNR